MLDFYLGKESKYFIVLLHTHLGFNFILSSFKWYKIPIYELLIIAKFTPVKTPYRNVIPVRHTCTIRQAHSLPITNYTKIRQLFQYNTSSKSHNDFLCSRNNAKHGRPCFPLIIKNKHKYYQLR